MEHYEPCDKVKQCVKENGVSILGITGKMMSGKDTAAEFMRFAFCHDSRVTWFARPLKQMMIEYFGFTVDDLYTTEGKQRYNDFWGMTNREALQRVGTECFRNNFHKDTWLKTMELNIMNKPSKLIIIPDVRFPNEADLIHGLGGTLIKIDRNIQRDDKQMKHASETEIDHLPCDGVIKNIGTRVEFFKSVLHTLDYFGFTERLQLSPRLPGTTLDRVLESEYFSALGELY